MIFDAEYYRSGNYLHYLKRRFDGLAEDIISELGIEKHAKIVDFGCGCGGIVDAMASRGYGNIVGTDISFWAINHGKLIFPGVADKLLHYNRNVLTEPHDVLLMLDVLEHMPEYEAQSTLQLVRQGLRGSALFRIPVCQNEGEPFVLSVSNNDPTHITCHNKNWWHNFFIEAGLSFVKAVNRPRIYSSDGVLVEIWKCQRTQ